MTRHRPHILVTDAHSTSALSVVRSLGSRGMRVTAAGEDGRCNLASYSRYIERALLWPRAEADPDGYLDALESELQRTPYDLLLPTTDTTVALVSHRRDRIERLVRLALPEGAALDATRDKARTMQVARDAGVTVPTTWVFSSLAEVEQMAPQLSYPCVIKPRFSCRWDGRGPLVRATVRYADSADALLRAYAGARACPDTLLVQELVTGVGVGVFILSNAGEPLATFAHRRLREANPTGGRASLAESIAADDRLLAPAKRLIEALRWTGVAMIEFKDPGPPAPPTLMEINGRLWGSLPLAITAGVDFPHLLTQLMFGEHIESQRPYKVGIRCRHLKGDISYLVAALKGRPRSWRGSYPTRVAALKAITPFPGRWHSYNFRLDDPMPAVRETADFLWRELMRAPMLRQPRRSVAG
jgi:predicted ATP-grasp superfamily ATP-dependent carboligase